MIDDNQLDALTGGGDCGTCIYCKDKRKFGGSGKLKKSCIWRRAAQCSNSTDMVAAAAPLTVRWLALS
jgi:hypothetical protein